MKTYWYDGAFSADSRGIIEGNADIEMIENWWAREEVKNQQAQTIVDALWAKRGSNPIEPTEEQLEKARMMNF